MPTQQTPEHLPPVACEPWCQYGDGHPDALSPRDQVCTSATSAVHLHREDSAKYTDGLGLAQVRTRLTRWPFEEAAVSLTVDTRGSESAVSLTPDEARQVATSLLELADRVTS